MVEEKFLIDSNSFMTPYRQYYAFDLVPTYWKETSGYWKNDDTIIRTQEDKMNFVRFLMEKDKEKQLSEYIRNGINTFYKIYENETIRG